MYASFFSHPFFENSILRIPKTRDAGFCLSFFLLPFCFALLFLSSHTKRFLKASYLPNSLSHNAHRDLPFPPPFLSKVKRLFLELGRSQIFFMKILFLFLRIKDENQRSSLYSSTRQSLPESRSTSKMLRTVPKTMYVGHLGGRLLLPLFQRQRAFSLSIWSTSAAPGAASGGFTAGRSGCWAF